jgi:hypothetical protein
MSDYRNAENTFQLPPNMVLSFEVNAAQANLMDWNSNQFVFFTAGHGIIHPEQVNAVAGLIVEVAGLDTYIKSLTGGSEHRQYLHLLAVCFENAQGQVTVYVRLLHDKKVKPVMSKQQLQAALQPNVARYGNPVTVDVTLDSENMSADKFAPMHHLTHYSVKTLIGWLDR